MKFKNIYQKSEESVEKALLNLWTLGNHPMRGAVKDMFQREPLMAEPVFQSTYGWQPTEDDSWKSYFLPDVIEKIGIGKKYPPYSHQASSWKTLLNKGEMQSIVVTSGTGSGKTECFMYPVINDIVEQNNPDAVQAIFLYPLNALMADQCDRLGELCDKFDGVKFAVYNGNTKERIVSGTPRKAGEHESQLRARNEIRQTPPQILLSNPSMLEYMLVRGSDQTIMEKSRGKLRWIVIDEAHSYSGSSAVELKYQIRRILDAFGTDISKVRFACTSATIGGENGTESLKEFISSLTGQDKNKIRVIGGSRQIPELDETELDGLLNNKKIDISSSKVMKVRQHINECTGLSLRTIWNELHGSMDGFAPVSALEELDNLCELNDLRGKPVLSLRAHFHMRTISGLYTCVNPNCKCNTSNKVYRNITSFAGTSCVHCNSTMLELIQCKECGQFMISGEVKSQTNTVRQHVEHKDITIGMQITDANGDDVLNRPTNSTWSPFVVTTVEEPYVQPIEEAHATKYRFDKNGLGLFLNQDVNGSYIKLEGENRAIKCPVCGESEGSFLHFNVPVDTLNKIVGRVLLEETASDGQQWGKYISFTDSRQGTAISAKNFNIESERIIAVAHLVKELTKKNINIYTSSTFVEKKKFYDFLSSPAMADNEMARQQRETLKAELETIKPSLSIKEASDCLYDTRLFDHLKSDDAHLDAYKAAVTRAILGHRTLRKPSVESLGIIEVVYKNMSKIKMPQILGGLRKYDGSLFTDQDWRDFLIIALDYQIRIGNSIQPLIPCERQYIREGNLSTPITTNESNSDVQNKKWPKVNQSSKGETLARQNRLVLLLCAALGINTPSDLSTNVATINSLLTAAWNDLTNPQYAILTKVIQNGRGYNDQAYYKDEHVGSYYLDLSPESTACEVKLLNHAWQCPLTHRLLNVIFCGYSPAMTGNVSARNFEKYKIVGDRIDMPVPESVDIDSLREWIENDSKVQNLKQKGLWSDLQDNYYLTETSYIAAEHSAQQSDDKLSEYTEKFKSNSINVLNCSTTMEMGVDIGDIEVVLMDTVPPGAANYLQRAGRAGRARQSKASAFTLCNASPIGMKAFHNPMWALLDSNDMKMVLASPVITQRHINSFLFHYYINEEIDKFTTVTNLEDFFGVDKTQPNSCADFIAKLHTYATDPVIKSDFQRVFGDIPYSANLTIQTMTSIMHEYWNSMDNLMAQYKKASTAFESDHSDTKAEKMMHAVYGQILRVRRENLLSYLSEKQFIPNANMPTGIVEFDYSDESTMRAKIDLYKKIKSIKSKIEEEQNGTNDPIRIKELKKQRREYQEKLERIKNSTTVSRDVRTALNEYAPGQTVVINERNYVSNGIALWDNMDGQPRRRYLYHCESCGHTKYSTYQLGDGSITCEGCNHDQYVSVIPRLAKRNVPCTEAYEPIKFRTTSNARTTRTEITEKRYYDIRVELTSLSWANRNTLNNVDFVSQQEGEIVYYNLGMGEGFAICSMCGRSVLDTSDKTEPLRDHNTLDGEPCVGGTLKRHVAFTGRQQTCYTAMRFYKDGTLAKDEGLAISMGVVLKRALVKYLHIDSNEIEFGIKNENDAVVLFIYDVNKGGCGYSMHLGAPVECQKILEIALQMMTEFPCHCENDVSDSGACSHCLIDRTTYRYRDLLSKSKAYAWLLEQKGNTIPVPSNILTVSPNAVSRHEDLGAILQKAALDHNVSEISICVSAKGGIEASDFTNVNNPVGKALNDAIYNSKTVGVYVEYNHDVDDFDTLYQLSNLKQQLVNFKVTPVKSLGDYPSLLIIKTDNGYKHIFTDANTESLTLSSDWVNCTDRLFEDDILPHFEEGTLPNIAQIKEKLATKGRIILEGDVPDNRYSVKKIFSQGICMGIIKDSTKIDFMQEILIGQHVSVNFSDAYVNSALAGLILTYMIAEIRDLFNCSIDDVTLQLESRKRNIGGDFNDYQSISRNFADENTCNEFLKDLFEEVLGVDYREDINTKHHRWLRFTSSKGTLELRPDHGIDGGWFTRVTYNDLNRGLDHSQITVSKSGYGTADVIYYIIMNKK